ncbi:hypothetical protein Bca4012_079939 [Brassica carinata]
MVGAAWILRDHQGNVLFHSRDAFTPSWYRLFAELICICWALQSIHDMGFRDVVLGIDSHDAFQAISNAIEHDQDIVIYLIRLRRCALDSIRMEGFTLTLPLEAQSGFTTGFKKKPSPTFAKSFP